MIRSWKRLASRVVGDYRVFRLVEHETLAPHDHEHRTTWTIEACDWVNVVPVTRGGEVVLVRQYRHGLDGVTLEIPGGMCEAGEEPARAAARELAEETGYAGELVPLGWVLPNPAIQTNRCHVFLARHAARVAEPRPDAGEDLEVVLEPLTRIPGLVQAGTIRHALVITAFALLEPRFGVLARLDGTLQDMIDRREASALDLARRIDPRLCLDDVLQPHDVPALADPDFQFEAGQLAGIRATQAALRAEIARLFGGGAT